MDMRNARLGKACWLARRRSVVLVGLAVVVAGCGGSAPSAGVSPSRRPVSGGAASLPDAAVEDLSWIGPTDGWALDTQPCAAGSCTRLAQTTDGAGRWQSLPDFSAQFSGAAYNCEKQACVGAVSFANPRVGYAYEPALLMTTDSGRSWQAQPGLRTETLSVARGRVYRVAYGHTGCPGPCQPTLQTARVGSAVWRTLIGALATPDRSGAAQIVSSGSTVLVALYGSQAGPMSAHAIAYRSDNAGATWRQAGDPCSGIAPDGAREEDLVALTAARGRFLAGLCTAHAGTPGGFVVTSTDAGASWQVAGALPPVLLPALIAAGSATTLAVSTGPTGGAGRFTAKLLVSDDGGRRWRLAATDHQELDQAGAPAWLGFQSSTVARWVGDPHGVWTTRDAGARWIRAAFN